MPRKSTPLRSGSERPPGLSQPDHWVLRWYHFDALHYLRIACRGYERDNQSSPAFLPLLPAAMRICNLAGLNALYAGVLLPNLAFALGLGVFGEVVWVVSGARRPFGGPVPCWPPFPPVSSIPCPTRSRSVSCSFPARPWHGFGDRPAAGLRQSGARLSGAAIGRDVRRRDTAGVGVGTGFAAGLRATGRGLCF